MQGGIERKMAKVVALMGRLIISDRLENFDYGMCTQELMHGQRSKSLTIWKLKRKVVINFGGKIRHLFYFQPGNSFKNIFMNSVKYIKCRYIYLNRVIYIPSLILWCIMTM